METKRSPYVADGGNEEYIFASYAHDDSKAVTDVDILSEMGYRIWYDNDIKKSADWDRVISRNIRGCSLFLVFVSNKSMSRDWVHDEFQLAREENKDIVPIFLEEAELTSEFGLTLTAIKKKQGVERFKYEGDLSEYYWELTKFLPKSTRKSNENRDCESLGMGLLPSISDIVKGRIDISNKELEQRRSYIVQNVLKELQNNPNAGYSIETVFQLTSDQTNAVENLSKTLFSDYSNSCPSNLLAHPLNIATAYLSPLRLVAGLITRLSENWPPLVSSYSNLVSKDKRGELEDLHYFVEFCWLAWGPSVLTTSLLADETTRFMVVQVAYGDEANSLPLIMRKDHWYTIVENFRDAHEESGRKEKFEHRQERGWPVRLENLLVVKPCADPFFEDICHHALFANMFGKSEADDPETIALYLPSIDDGIFPGVVRLKTNKQEAFYSTAYVWLMLEQVGDFSQPLEPGRVIPFFEHANLATSKGLQFLQRCLARKAIYHILECEQDPDYQEKGVYRFASALFPEQMVEVMVDEIGRLKMADQKVVRRRLMISDDAQTWRSPAEVVCFADAVGARIMSALREQTNK